MTLTVTDKTMQTMGNPTISRDEMDGIAQVFGLRVIDLRRMTDDQAESWFTDILNRYGADCVLSALGRVRRLAGRERGFWLTSLAVVDPTLAPLMKAPPNWTDAQVWILTFGTFVVDEMKKLLQQIEARRMEAALQEQL